jgi:hypothetical protein
LVKVVNFFKHDDWRDQLRGQVRLNMRNEVQNARTQLFNAMNQTKGGLKTQGKIDQFGIVGIWSDPQRQVLRARARAVGSLEVALASASYADASLVISPTNPGFQCLPDIPADVNVSLSVAGAWRFSGGPTPFVGPNGHDRVIQGQHISMERGGAVIVQVKELNGAQRSIGVYREGAPMFIPQKSRVCVVMNDDTGFYGDNESAVPMVVRLTKAG